MKSDNNYYTTALKSVQHTKLILFILMVKIIIIRGRQTVYLENLLHFLKLISVYIHIIGEYVNLQLPRIFHSGQFKIENNTEKGYFSMNRGCSILSVKFSH